MDPFEVLSVNESSTKDEIIASYKRLALLHHPDKGGCESKFREIEEAKGKLLQRLDDMAFLQQDDPFVQRMKITQKNDREQEIGMRIYQQEEEDEQMVTYIYEFYKDNSIKKTRII